MSRSRRFCFTLNNYTQEEVDRLKLVECSYLVFGKEVGEQGTPHLQGYIEFSSAKTLSALKKNVHATAHFEVSKGNSKQAADYCKKDGDFFELGERSKTQEEKGELNADRWKNARLAAERGDMDSIPDDLRCQYYNTWKRMRIDALANIALVDLTPEQFVAEWLYGPSGSGKSLTARRENPGAYIKDPSSKWWDGYTHQEVVIFDDVDLKQENFSSDYKRWFDVYVCPVEVKGGMINIRPKKIVVTSNYLPEQIWRDPILLSAINRRFTIRYIGTFSQYSHSFTPPPRIHM